MIKNLDEINKPSKGTELLQSLKETPKIEDVSTIITPPKSEQSDPEIPQNESKGYVGGVIDGVEVVDVKAIEKDKKKLREE